MQFKVEKEERHHHLIQPSFIISLREEIKEAFRKYFLQSDDVENLDKEIDKVIKCSHKFGVLSGREDKEKEWLESELKSTKKDPCCRFCDPCSPDRPGSVINEHESEQKDELIGYWDRALWDKRLAAALKNVCGSVPTKDGEVRTRTGSYFTDTMGMLSPIHPPTPIDFSKAFKKRNAGQDRLNEKLSEEIARAGKWVDPISEIFFSSLEENK